MARPGSHPDVRSDLPAAPRAPDPAPRTGTLERELDRDGEAIRDMFAEVAPRYDLLNRLTSASLDVLWRRRLARALALTPGDEVLDLCCGTGDQAKALAAPGVRVAAADFCLPMLALARGKLAGPTGAGDRRPDLLAADALALPFPAARFSAAAVSFGLRNVADLDRALAELGRVLIPGGRLAVLEFALPRSSLLRRVYLLYFRRALPLWGRLLSPRAAAYRYLPASVMGFPQRRDFLARMEAAGFTDTAWKDLSAGTVCLYTGRRTP